MENKDELQNLWQAKQTGDESNYYHLIENELIKKAKMKSNDIFSQVRKNMIIELWASGLILLVVPFIFNPQSTLHIIFLILLVISLIISIKVYGSYLTQINRIQSENMLTALKSKAALLRTYIKRLKWYVYFISPVAFYIGFGMSLETHQGFELTSELLFKVAFGLPFLGLFIWLMSKYIHALYGKHLEKLEDILIGFETE